jgi:hypothetical protein
MEEQGIFLALAKRSLIYFGGSVWTKPRAWAHSFNSQVHGRGAGRKKEFKILNQKP